MIKALLGRKLGMTQIYREDGRVAPVTVLRAGPCTVLQVKKPDTDGYNALQLGFDDRKPKNVTRPILGHIAKAMAGGKAEGEAAKPEEGKKAKKDFSKVVAKQFIREVGWDGKDEVATGQEVKLDILEGATYLDVTGWSKGRGFAGVVKRHHFRGGPRTHGQSDRERAPGAVGRAHSISKGVLPGKRMAGHFGDARITVKNLEVVKVDKEQNLVFVEGAVPGPTDAFVLIQRSPRVKRVRHLESEKKAEKKKAAMSKGVRK
jgi:large subunit ribosomal protein L3